MRKQETVEGLSSQGEDRQRDQGEVHDLRQVPPLQKSSVWSPAGVPPRDFGILLEEE